MRWDNLFDDLESQLEHELGAEEVDLRAEEERLRLGRLSMRDRLMALVKAEEAQRHTTADDTAAVNVLLISGTTLAILPRVFGKDWLAGQLLEESHRRSQCVLALGAIASIVPTRAQLPGSLHDVDSAPEGVRLIDRLGLAFVLRDLCRRRAAIELAISTGMIFGTIDRVGRDHLDLAVHEPGTPRRESSVSHYLIVPLAQILYVRL